MEKTNGSMEIKVKKWTKAKIIGNNKCPKCKKGMIIIPTTCTTVAYCLKCESYYFDKDALNGFNVAMGNLDKHIKEMNIGG